MKKIDVSIGVSNRHVHLTEEVFKKLFGEEAFLEKQKDLTQPGEFASTSKVTIKTEKSVIENVRVLGPLRKYTQVEISKTDAFKLGVNPLISLESSYINLSVIKFILSTHYSYSLFFQ